MDESEASTVCESPQSLPGETCQGEINAFVHLIVNFYADDRKNILSAPLLVSSLPDTLYEFGKENPEVKGRRNFYPTLFVLT